MKLLPSTYGWDSYDGAYISLYADEPVDNDELERILLGYSCHPPAIPKIKTCLYHSGRYDCVLQATWFRYQQENVTRDLSEIGVTLKFHGFLKDIRPCPYGLK